MPPPLPVCPVCQKQISAFSDLAQSAGKKWHLTCYTSNLESNAFERGRASIAIEKREREEFEARVKLAAERAKLRRTCVHCDKPFSDTAPDGIGVVRAYNKVHCLPCYMARDYGEAQAAQGASKSQAGIENVAATLAKPEAPKVEVPAPKAQEPALDRFQLLELDFNPELAKQVAERERLAKIAKQEALEAEKKRQEQEAKKPVPVKKPEPLIEVD